MLRAMSKDMIADITGAFGEAARRYEEAGYEGIEIIVSHGLLLTQFLNPETNVREDDYGGSRENRLRFPREVIANIRAAVERKLVLGIRISGDKLNACGLETPEVLHICKELDADGQLDFFDICGGSMTGIGGSIHVVPPMQFEPGYLAPISCIQHSETGRETDLGRKVAAETRLKVLVAGRGPVGMKAAAVAAERDLDVTQCERGAELDGQVKLARQLPDREEFRGIVTNLTREMECHGVEVRLNTNVDIDLLNQLKPDVVVIATGAGVHVPENLLLDGAHAVHANQVLEGANVGTRVVIADWRCDWVGLSLAERLARDGCYVRLAANGYMPGQSI